MIVCKSLFLYQIPISSIKHLKPIIVFFKDSSCLYRAHVLAQQQKISYLRTKPIDQVCYNRNISSFVTNIVFVVLDVDDNGEDDLNNSFHADTPERVAIQNYHILKSSIISSVHGLYKMDYIKSFVSPGSRHYPTSAINATQLTRLHNYSSYQFVVCKNP